MTTKSAGTRLFELRRSGAAGRHQDTRLRRVRDRSTARRRAIEEQT